MSTSDPRTLIDVVISSKEKPEDLVSVINIFRGASTSGNTYASKIEVIHPSELSEDAGLDPDYLIVRNALRDAAEDSYVIVCKDTAVAVATSQTIFDVIEATIASSSASKANEFDIFYLANWADRCDQYTNMRDVGGRGLKVVNTVSPNGALCLLFSPAGRAKFLGIFEDGIQKDSSVKGRTLGYHLHGKIGSRNNIGAHDSNVSPARQRFFATTSSPSLVQFDITKRKNNADFAKTVECRDVPSPSSMSPNKKSSNMGFFWFVVIVIVVLAIAWALIKFGTRTTACSGGYCPVPSMAPMVPVGSLVPAY